MFYSIIIPTFKRPEEVVECLQSLTQQKFKDFEVIIADGTPGKSLEDFTTPFISILNLSFLYEEYLGVSEARNLGAQHAKGEWLIFLDSDCIIPEDYLLILEKQLPSLHADLFGGPDAAHPDFTPLQKAVSFSMTSLLTTGGIRGKKSHVGTFHPRGFNMGIKKSAFQAVNGYSTFKCGEDIELSIRLIKAGFKAVLVPEAFVYHKRRTSFQQFYKQVFRFGAARINIWSRHSEELKLTHLFPSLFLISFGIAMFLLPLSFFLSNTLLALPAFFFFLYFNLIFILAYVESKSLEVAWLAIPASCIQMFGYGYGFLYNAFEVIVRKNTNGIKL